ncbi:MAG: hypothetical protein KF850_30965 [Labilithrix sp.]|nr:hypothetical protein [Labilithrix sp.]
MDVRTELEQEPWPSDGLDRAAPPSAPTQGEPAPPPRTVAARHVLEEASFLVVESGRIHFFVRPRVAAEAPAKLEDVDRVTFTLAPRNRSVVRRLSLSERQLPGDRVRERKTAHVDRVGVAEPQPGSRRRARKARGARERAGAIEVARGTYAIASHRDHTHLMYELDAENAAFSPALLRQLGIAPRASYVALVQNPESRWRVSDRAPPDGRFPGARPREGAGRVDDDLDKRRFTPLDPVFLEHEGTELVLVGGRSEADSGSTCARS